MSPGAGKNMQKLKKCLPKIDRKKGRKKGGDPPRPGSSAAAFARPVGMQDSCSGRFLPWFRVCDLPTPPLQAECGGFCSHARRPPHSTKLLALVYVKKLIRILTVSARILTEPWRFLAESCLTKCNRVRKKQYQEIGNNYRKIRSKTSKSIELSKNASQAKKITSRNGKGTKKYRA